MVKDVTKEFTKKYPKTVRDLVNISGFDGTYKILEVTEEDLNRVGTICGEVGNNALSGLVGVVDKVYILVDEDNIYNDNGYYEALSMAVKCSKQIGKKIERLIDKHGGGMRFEDEINDGFYIFESE